jgi:hypothetical protein
MRKEVGVNTPDDRRPAVRAWTSSRTRISRADFVMAAYDENQRSLTSFAYALTRDADAADDLVHESRLEQVVLIEHAASLHRVRPTEPAVRHTGPATSVRYAAIERPPLTNPASHGRSKDREACVGPTDRPSVGSASIPSNSIEQPWSPITIPHSVGV